MKSDNDELLAVLEKIRKEKHPEIPAEVIKTIVSIQRDNQENVAIRQGKMKNYLEQISKGLGEES